MAVVDPIGINLSGIAGVLATNALRVPPNQRSYAWGTEQVTDLLDDLQKAIAADAPVYYLGTITLRRTAERAVEVVDGQQRLTTAVILLCAIRDYLLEHGDMGTAEKLHHKYLIQPDVWSPENNPRLTLNAVDDLFYRSRVLAMPGDTSVTAIKQSHERISQAARLARERIYRLVDGAADPVSVLKTWVDYLDDAGQCLVFRVPNEMNPYTIFETLNGRGLQLSPTDNLKNYLFGLAADQLDQVQLHWSEMVGALDAGDIRKEGVLTDYIKSFWSSTRGLTRREELFRRIRERVTTKADAVKTAADLAASAKHYAAIVSPSEDNWRRFGPVSREYMEALNLLGLVQIRPLLLSILDRFAPADVSRAMSLMVATAVRVLVSGRSGSGAVEGHYTEAALRVRNRSIGDCRQLVAYLKPLVPGDAEFKSQMSVATVTKSNVARYYLRVLEAYRTGGREPELVPNPDTGVVNLEHVLPKNPSDAWFTVISEEEAAAYVYRLGNMVLMNTRLNNRGGSDTFLAKRSFLAASPFALTKAIATNGRWGIQEIEARQAVLAALAPKAWPLR